MHDVMLIVDAPDGTREVPLTCDRLSIGSSRDSSLSINDEALAPVHASIHREGERLWIVDETRGGECYVGGSVVPPSGAPLSHGDEIILSAQTSITINLRQRAESVQAAGTAQSPYLHYAALALGVLVTLIAAVGFSSYARREGSTSDVGRRRPPSKIETVNRTGAADSNLAANSYAGSAAASKVLDAHTEAINDNNAAPPALTRDGASALNSQRYAAMSEAERANFVAERAQHIARSIGNRDGHAFSPEALQRIKNNVDGYASRARLAPTGGCRFGQSLQTLLERGSQSAPFINRAFNEKGLSPVVGLYLAMIESEYCACLTSPTGPKGMFQFTRATARTYGLNVIEPEERCLPEKAAPAAAGYMKALIGRYGTGPLSVPLSIASYNSGEGDLSRNLFKALDAVRTSDNPERSFWTLVANEDKLTDQFQRENIKYVPKFFAAAIIGENPRVFGVEMEPLSSY